MPQLFLYGGPKPFIPPPWTPISDQLRGGTSYSSMIALPSHGVVFRGNLDARTLGGAGFAAQYCPWRRHGSEIGFDDDGGAWDLRAYAGLEVVVGRGVGGRFTLVLKDGGGVAVGGGEEEEEEGNGDGDGNGASVSFEAEFVPSDDGDLKTVWIPWVGFKAMYRGRPVLGAEINRGEVRRIGLMMRR